MPARQSLFSLAAHRISFMSRQAMALPTLAVATLVTLAALPASGQLLTMPPNSGASSTRGNSNYQDLNLDALNLPPGTVSDAPQSQVSDSSISAPPSYNAGDFAPGAASYTGGGAAYSTALGAHLRARYNTRSYGQYQGNFDLGTSKFFSDGDRMWFIDGQVTMNDESQVGYNLGAGFRQMTLPVFPNSPDSEKIVGLSIWSDGSNTRNNDFISQLGLSFEYLGDRLDLRANTYIPLGRDQYSSDLVPTGELSYESNFLIRNAVGELETPLTVGEIEGAARISDLDLWGFTGVYGMGGEGVDTAGFRAGIRGYATPDVLLQIGVTHDDLFATNTVFSATWFIGRTHADSCLTGRLIDRMREPVMRNDYVAIYSEVLTGGDPLTDADTNEAARFVFVDANAAAGGTGTFESPFASLDDVFAASQDNDRVLINSGGTFTNQSLALRDGQQVLGFGLNANDTTPTAQIYSLNTTEIGTIDLPEPFTGANGSTVSTIDAAPGAAITLAQNNTVRGLQFDGGTNAIDGTAADIGSTTLQELTISNTTGNGIVLAPSAQTTTDFGVAVDNVNFDNVGGDDISIDGSNTPATAASVTINNIESRNNQGRGIFLTETNTNTAANISNIDYDGGAASTAGIELNQTDGAVTLGGTSTLTGGIAGGRGIYLNQTAGTVNVGASVSVNDVTGTGVEIDGSTATVTYQGTVTNADNNAVIVQNTQGATNFTGAIVNDAGAGPSVQVNNVAGNTFFSGAVTDNGGGIDITNNNNASIVFTGITRVTTSGATNGVDITNNANPVGGDSGTVVEFDNLAVTTDSGVGINATNGGTLTINGAQFNNAVTTETGQTLNLDNVVIGAAGVNFGDVTTNGTVTGAAALRLNDLGGTGTVAITGGTLNSDSNTVDITNAPNVSLEDMTINSSGTNAIRAVYNSLPTTDGDSDIALAINSVTTNNDLDLDVADTITGDVSFTLEDSGSNVNNTIAGSVSIDAANSGEFDLLVRDTQISSGTTESLGITLENGITNSDILVGDVNFSTTTASALRLTTSGATAKQVNFELTTIDDRNPLTDSGTNMLTNNDADATEATAVFDIGGSTTLDLTIDGADNNIANDNAAGRLFNIIANQGAGETTNINLNMNGLQTTTDNSVTGTLSEQGGATFQLFERDATLVGAPNARNNNVEFDFGGGNVIGDFTDTPTAPTTTQFTQ